MSIRVSVIKFFISTVGWFASLNSSSDSAAKGTSRRRPVAECRLFADVSDLFVEPDAHARAIHPHHLAAAECRMVGERKHQEKFLCGERALVDLKLRAGVGSVDQPAFSAPRSIDRIIRTMNGGLNWTRGERLSKGPIICIAVSLFRHGIDRRLQRDLSFHSVLLRRVMLYRPGCRQLAANIAPMAEEVALKFYCRRAILRFFLRANACLPVACVTSLALKSCELGRAID